MGVNTRRGGRWWWYAIGLFAPCTTTNLLYESLWGTHLNRRVSLPMQTSNICVLSHKKLGEDWGNRPSSRARTSRASHFGLAGERAGGL